ncbi:unnamed protein product [Ranitomeya imitator]|uniref:Uncharacterized protein n=1 Tax=Ranitomeya imitator TaxID=111125 RepID=A0ABN9LHH8_9NEOB|nr:unnamed protein product [Ranitomeya imitator]
MRCNVSSWSNDQRETISVGNSCPTTNRRTLTHEDTHSSEWFCAQKAAYIFDWNVVILNGISSFLKQHMGAAGPETPDVEALRLEIAELKQKYEAVLEENKELKAKLAQLEPQTDEKRPE